MILWALMRKSGVTTVSVKNKGHYKGNCSVQKCDGS